MQQCLRALHRSSNLPAQFWKRLALIIAVKREHGERNAKVFPIGLLFDC